MTGATELLIAAPTAMALAPVVWYAAQILCGLVPSAPRRPAATEPRRLAVLIPAHDEAERIETVLHALLPLPDWQDRVFVIADNCRDATARRAARHDVTVLERNDAGAFGKGHALAWALARPELAAFDLVGVVDADTTACRAAVTALKQESLRTGHPVQGCYLHSAPAAADAWGAFSRFAVMVNNLVRQRGRRRLGIPAQINGSGFVMPMAAARAVPWASDRLAEDAELGLDLSLAGHDPRFVEDAVILSPAPAGEQQVLDQRSGWISGRLALSARRVAQAVAIAIRQRRPTALLAALDQAVPSASLLAATLGFVLPGILAAGRAGAKTTVPLVLWAVASGTFVIALVLAWAVCGRSALTIGTAVKLPWMLSRQAWVVAGRLARGRWRWRHYRGERPRRG